MPLGHRNMFVALKQERFTGTNVVEIRHVYTQLVQCTSHMHQKEIIHADIKTLNLVRIDAHRFGCSWLHWRRLFSVSSLALRPSPRKQDCLGEEWEVCKQRCDRRGRPSFGVPCGGCVVPGMHPLPVMQHRGAASTAGRP